MFKAIWLFSSTCFTRHSITFVYSSEVNIATSYAYIYIVASTYLSQSLARSQTLIWSLPSESKGVDRCSLIQAELHCVGCLGLHESRKNSKLPVTKSHMMCLVLIKTHFARPMFMSDALKC